MATKTRQKGAPRSVRGRQRYTERKLTPLEQIRVPGGPQGAELTGAWAYYLRPEGATIRDALIIYPNGGVPDIPDQRSRAKFGRNADLYRARNRAKGFEYLGPKLTEEAVVKLVETIESNREDEILFVEDEIADAEETAANSDIPEVRQQAKKRRAQLQRRLEYLTEDVDQEKLATELKDIARAQMLADVDPMVLQVMKTMIGEVNETVAKALVKFQRGKKAQPEDNLRQRAREGSTDVLDEGVDHIDVD